MLSNRPLYPIAPTANEGMKIFENFVKFPTSTFFISSVASFSYKEIPATPGRSGAKKKLSGASHCAASAGEPYMRRARFSFIFGFEPVALRAEHGYTPPHAFTP